MRRRGVVTACAATLLLAACATGGQQSALDPAGERAEAIDGLWQLMAILGTVVWIAVVVLTVWAPFVRRRRERPSDGDPEAADARRPFWLVVLAGAVVPGVVVALLTVVSASVLTRTEVDEAGEATEVVEVVGHQWWWEVRYPEHAVVSANEVHIPVGERIRIELTSDDVIHSFWVPELSGKLDMIPGETNAMWVQADEPGTYWGQCAEFCGVDHAYMRFLIVAHERDEFEGWVAAQGETAEFTPGLEESAAVARGREIFMSSSCVYCHTIEGTAARGSVGPDLTHLASRETLAAGTLPNTRGDLAGWLLDPQAIKPGNRMPGTELDGEELQFLLDYLESLE